jgi:rare lipoprotein A
MSRFECARTAQTAPQVQIDTSFVPAVATLCRRPARLLFVVGAASLAACAQSPVGRQRADLNPSHQVAVERHHYVRTAALHPRPIRPHRSHVASAASGEGTSHGVASFYWEGTETASGEKFDKNELTAAHPTLPFGTRLRVTNVSTGRSVTVRVNDRGPYVRGRVVDVSPSAAEALGMVDKGLANVRLDVVQ